MNRMRATMLWLFTLVILMRHVAILTVTSFVCIPPPVPKNPMLNSMLYLHLSKRSSAAMISGSKRNIRTRRKKHITEEVGITVSESSKNSNNNTHYNTNTSFYINEIRACTNLEQIRNFTIQYQQTPEKHRQQIVLVETIYQLIYVLQNVPLTPSPSDDEKIRFITRWIHSAKITAPSSTMDSMDSFVLLTNALYNITTSKKQQRNNKINNELRNCNHYSNELAAILVSVLDQLFVHLPIQTHPSNVDRNNDTKTFVTNSSTKRLVSYILAIHRYIYCCTSSMNKVPTVNSLSSSSLYGALCKRLCDGDRIHKLTSQEIYYLLRSIDLKSWPFQYKNTSVTLQLTISLVRRLRKLKETDSTTVFTKKGSTLIPNLDQLQRLLYTLSFPDRMHTPLKPNDEDLSAPTVVQYRNIDDGSLSSKVQQEIKLTMYRLLHYALNPKENIAPSIQCTDRESALLSSQIQQQLLRCTTHQQDQCSLHELGVLATTIRTVINSQNEVNSSNASVESQPDSIQQHPLVEQFQRLVVSNIFQIVSADEEETIAQDQLLSFPKSNMHTVFRDIFQILYTWTYYHQPVIVTQVVDVNQTTLSYDAINLLGRYFERIADHQIRATTGSTTVVSNFYDKKRKDIHSILRVVAFFPTSYPTESYYAAFRRLLLHDEFLKSCTVSELSNFCWFLAFKSNKYYYHDHSLITTLAKHVSKPEIRCICTPKEASRVLSGFTSLCYSDTGSIGSRQLPHQQQHRYSDLLSNLFQCYGEYLLEASTLSPYDASSATYAYAKANYIYDMGIFDHLVDVYATHVETNPSSCTTRQICQTLWSCGKMMSLESSSSDMDDLVDKSPDDIIKPPYYNSFINMVSYVTYRADELSPQDITQTLWAMSHFRFFDGENTAINIDLLLERVLVLIPKFNTQERANILWSFSKMPSLSPLVAKTIFLLTRAFVQSTNTNSNENTKMIDQPQEASIILYSLGRMNIRDIDVFQSLTNHVLEYYISSASAQTIANILWAHRMVHIEPPQQLLDNWATIKFPNITIASSSSFYGNIRSDTIPLLPYNQNSFY